MSVPNKLGSLGIACATINQRNISYKFISSKIMSNNKHLAAGAQKPELPDDGVLRLFSMRFCPYAQRVHLILDLKKIPYHTININLTEKPEWLTDFSPLGKVPALQLVKDPKRTVLIESLVIVEYLDEMYPQSPLFPKDPLQRALDKILVERFGSAVTSPLYKVMLGQEPASLTDISNGLDIYEQELRTRGFDFFSGEKPGFVDYMIWPWCERSDMLKYLIGDKYELDQDRFKHLLKWRELMLKDDAVKCSYLDGETHAKFIKGRRINQADYDMLVNDAKRQKVF